MWKIIRQNRALFTVVLLFIVFFSLVLFSGVRRIYRMEAAWRHDVVTERLNSAKLIIISGISDYKNHLIFLSRSPQLVALAEGGYRSAPLKEQLLKILGEHSEAFNEFDGIRLTDPEGVTILDTGNTPADSAEASTQGKAPGLQLTVPLIRSKSVTAGRLTATLELSSILDLFPENIFLQDETGRKISLGSDGTVVYERSSQRFPPGTGMLRLSKTETIHHTTIEIIPGRTFTVAMVHHHNSLAGEFKKLAILAGGLLSIFICLITAISYINLLRFSEKVRTQKAIIASLVEMTDWRDPETGGHLVRTQTYSVALALQLRGKPGYRKIVTKEFIENLHEAAPLHDIGKVGISDAILLKEGKLTDQEFSEMKRHCLIGGKLLLDMIDDFGLRDPFIIMAREITHCHHEKYDGSGYPEGLKGDEIPLAARIFALADVYDALRSKRPYKQAMSHAKAIAIIRGDSQTHFDPDIVDAFMEIEGRLETLSNQN